MRAPFIAALILCSGIGTAQAESASFYGSESGRRTASGERFDPSAMTAAHRALPFNTLVRVTFQGRSVVVRINDRGPWIKGRDIDLSEGAARRIRCPGLCQVSLDIVGAPYVPKHGDWGVF